MGWPQAKTGVSEKPFQDQGVRLNLKNLYLEGAALLDGLTTESITVSLIPIDEKRHLFPLEI
jgi:hypothetical protein